MKTIPEIILGIVVVLLTTGLVHCQIDTLEISEGWQFRQATDLTWHAAHVPGTVQEDLLNLGMVPDPYYALNEDSLTWIEENDWVYVTKFKLSEAQLKKTHHYLSFEGLDTYAEVFLNGQKILNADNMHRSWQVEVREHLASDNDLKIIFHSPIKVGKQYMDGLPCQLPAGNDSGGIKVMPVVRKAAFHFGWDWGPRIVTMGIWRPVKLISYDSAIKSMKFEGYDIIKHGKKNHAKVKVGVDTELESPSQVAHLIIDENVVDTVEIIGGKQEFVFHIEDPELWWPRGQGKQKLYTCSISIPNLDKRSIKIGLRKVELMQEKDSIGTSFYFKINDRPVFAKGANYIPQSHFTNSKSQNDYRKLLNDAAESNMNMVRVWGGGIYEEDIFYELCDSLGLMVWQDMMFANTMYPVDTSFYNNILAEIEDNVSRLHHHPSIVHWCGNNEIDVAWHNWGWQKEYDIPKDYQRALKTQYDMLFKNSIPKVIHSILPEGTYSHTSPLSNWGTDENFNHHSMHYWGVFHGEDPFEDYAKNIGRFNSEYGFQSFPNISTINKYFSVSTFDLDDPRLAHRQKSYKGNRLIYKHISDYYPLPTDLTSLSYLSQLTQAKGIGYAIQNHRLSKGHSMGSLYWQLNDCWPAISWSGIDGDGQWRALQYTVKRNFADVGVFIDTLSGSLDLVIVNDKPDTSDVLCHYKMIHKGEIVHEQSVEATLLPHKLHRQDLQRGIKVPKLKLDVIHVDVESDGKRYAFSHTLKPVEEMDLKVPHLSLEWKEEDTFCLYLSSDVFVKDLYLYSELETRYSDNFFDLLPNSKKKVILESDDDLKSLESLLKYTSLNHILRENHERQ